MNDAAHLAFVDDYGDSGLKIDKSGTTEFYIMCGVAVCAAAETDLRRDVEVIRQRHFQTGEMKSTSVGRKDGRRRAVLRDLCNLEFRAFAFVVEKEPLARSRGYHFHHVFVKNLALPIYQQLSLRYADLTIVADQHGDVPFMESFRHYIKRRTSLANLFQSLELSFTDSRDCVLVQLADFIAGTLGRCFGGRKSPCHEEFLQLLQPHIVIRRWPGDYKLHLREEASRGMIEYDPAIAEYSVDAAVAFCDRYAASRERKAQVVFVEHLLSHLTHSSATKYVSTHDLLSHLSREAGFDPIIGAFRRGIVAAVRDSGVLISSCHSGYKIPISLQDVRTYFSHALVTMRPMAERLYEARQQVRIATEGKIDLLEFAEYATLRAMLQDKPDI